MNAFLVWFRLGCFVLIWVIVGYSFCFGCSFMMLGCFDLLALDIGVGVVNSWWCFCGLFWALVVWGWMGLGICYCYDFAYILLLWCMFLLIVAMVWLLILDDWWLKCFAVGFCVFVGVWWFRFAMLFLGVGFVLRFVLLLWYLGLLVFCLSV